MRTWNFRTVAVITLALSVPLVQAQVAATHYFDTWRLGERGTLAFGGAALPVALANTGPFVLGRENSICDPISGDLLISAGYNWLHEADGDTMAGSMGLFTYPQAIVPHPGNNDPNPTHTYAPDSWQNPGGHWFYFVYNHYGAAPHCMDDRSLRIFD